MTRPEIIDPGSVETVVFDYGNVLSMVEHGHFLPALVGNEAPSFDRLNTLVYGSGSLLIEFECGRISSEEFKKQIEAAAGQKFETDLFEHRYNDMFRPVPQMRELVKLLARAGFWVGLLSNTSDIHFRKEIMKNPVFELFDPVVVSFRVGAMKPDKRMFEAVLDACKTTPDKILFLDDLADNIAAALNQGIKALRITDPENQAGELAELFCPNINQ